MLENIQKLLDSDSKNHLIFQDNVYTLNLKNLNQQSFSNIEKIKLWLKDNPDDVKFNIEFKGGTITLEQFNFAFELVSTNKVHNLTLNDCNLHQIISAIPSIQGMYFLEKLDISNNQLSSTHIQGLVSKRYILSENSTWALVSSVLNLTSADFSGMNSETVYEYIVCHISTHQRLKFIEHDYIVRHYGEMINGMVAKIEQDKIEKAKILSKINDNFEQFEYLSRLPKVNVLELEQLLRNLKVLVDENPTKERCSRFFRCNQEFEEIEREQIKMKMQDIIVKPSKDEAQPTESFNEETKKDNINEDTSNHYMKYFGIYISADEKGKGLDVVFQLEAGVNVLNFLAKVDNTLVLLEQVEALKAEKKNAKWIDEIHKKSDGSYRLFLRLVPFYDVNGKPSIIINPENLIFNSLKGQQAWLQLVSLVDVSTVTFEKSAENDEYKILCTPSLHDPIGFLKPRRDLNPLVEKFLEIFYAPEDPIDHLFPHLADEIKEVRKKNQEVLNLIKQDQKFFPEYFHMRKTLDHLMVCINDQRLRMLAKNYRSHLNTEINPVFLSNAPELSYGKVGVAFSEWFLFHNRVQGKDIFTDEWVMSLIRRVVDESGSYWITKNEICQPMPFVMIFQDPLSYNYQKICEIIAEKAPLCKILTMHETCINFEKWDQYLKIKNEQQDHYPFTQLSEQLEPKTYISVKIEKGISVANEDSASTISRSSVSVANLMSVAFNNVTAKKSMDGQREITKLMRSFENFFQGHHTGWVTVDNYCKLAESFFANKVLLKKFTELQLPENHVEIKEILKLILCHMIRHGENDEVIEPRNEIAKNFAVSCLMIRKDAFECIEKPNSSWFRSLSPDKTASAISWFNGVVDEAKNWQQKRQYQCMSN